MTTCITVVGWEP